MPPLLPLLLLSDAPSDPEKGKEGESVSVEKDQKKPDQQTELALLGAEVTQGARTQLAAETEGVDPDQDRDTDTDGALDTDTEMDFPVEAEKLAHKVEQTYGVPWQVCLAQALLESNNGESGLTKNHFNTFGCKAGASYTGDKVLLPTEEVIDGRRVKTQDYFRSYKTLEESFMDYGRLLSTPRYEEAMQYKNNPQLFLKKVLEHGYAGGDAEHQKSYLKSAMDRFDKIAKEHGFELFPRDAGDGVASSTETPAEGEKKPEDKGLLETIGDKLKSWTSSAAEFIKKWSGKAFDGITAGIASLGASLGFKWFQKKEEEVPALSEAPSGTHELLANWREVLQSPEAPAFSFPKEYPAGTPLNVSVSDVIRVREVHPVTHDRRNHNGDDIPAPLGAPIYSTTKGTVIDSWYDRKTRVDPTTGKAVESGGGNVVKVRYPDGHIAMYMHLKDKGAEKGTELEPGSWIGDVGKTGGATGPHLHYETHDADNRVVDPAPYLDQHLQIAQQEEQEERHLA